MGVDLAKIGVLLAGHPDLARPRATPKHQLKTQARSGHREEARRSRRRAGARRLGGPR